MAKYITKFRAFLTHFFFVTEEIVVMRLELFNLCVLVFQFLFLVNIF